MVRPREKRHGGAAIGLGRAAVHNPICQCNHGCGCQGNAQQPVLNICRGNVRLQPVRHRDALAQRAYPVLQRLEAQRMVGPGGDIEPHGAAGVPRSIVNRPRRPGVGRRSGLDIDPQLRRRQVCLDPGRTVKCRGIPPFVQPVLRSIEAGEVLHLAPGPAGHQARSADPVGI